MGQPSTGTITLLFSDIEGSTALLRRLGDRYGEALSVQRALLRDAREPLRRMLDYVASASDTELVAHALEGQER